MPYFVIGPDGKEYGPHEISTLVTWIQQNQLPAHAILRNLQTGQQTTASQTPELRSYYASQYSHPPGAPQPQRSQGSTLLPTGNPDALWAYYLGVASLVCFIGLLIIPFSIFKAVKGSKAYQANPSVKGIAHVVVAYVLCGISVLLHLFFIFLAARSS